MEKFILVGFLPGVGKWFGRQRGGYYEAHEDINEVMGLARETKLPIVIDKNLSLEDTLAAIAAATFGGVTIVNESGQIITKTPVKDSAPRYITARDIGRVIPDGWMVECQLNRYSAMFGEEMAFPARQYLWQAINDIRGFLAASALQASNELAASLAAQTALENSGKQLSLWSSDSRASGAVETSTELDQ